MKEKNYELRVISSRVVDLAKLIDVLALNPKDASEDTKMQVIIESLMRWVYDKDKKEYVDDIRDAGMWLILYIKDIGVKEVLEEVIRQMKENPEW